MNDGIILVILVVVGLPVCLVIWLIARAVSASRRIGELEWQTRRLRADLDELRRASPERQISTPQTVAAPLPSPAVAAVTVVTPPPPVVTAPPLIPPVATEQPADLPKTEVPPRVTSPRSVEAKPFPVAINWEQFMGVKMFAWIGGLALFLGVAFFVKYSFENNLITPEMRVAIGYVTGAGLLIGGLMMARKDYEVLGLTLCSTGVLVLYATTFGAHVLHHLIPFPATFAVMILITATAFLLAVKLDAQVVAVLGLLGGFLTPVLINTGKDNPLGLFGYIGLLDAGLIAIAARRQWKYQVLLSAIGTALMQLVWVVKFFAVEKTYTAMGIFLGMETLFLLGFVLAQHRAETNPWVAAGAFVLAFTPLLFALDLLTLPSIAGSPAQFFTFVLAADLGLLALATLRAPLWRAHLAAGGAVFLVLTIWTLSHLTASLLNWALGVYLLFAVLHSVYPIILQRLRPGLAPVWWGQLFPLLALVLVMVPIFNIPELGFVVWLCVLMLDLIVFALALATASLMAVIGALLLTVVATAIWVLKIPATLTGLPDLLVVIGGFAIVFFVLGAFVTRKMAQASASGSPYPGPLSARLVELPLDVRAQIPALSAILPFLLLVMVVVRLPLDNPLTVFGLAMLLVVLLLGVAKMSNVDALAAVGLLCTLGLEYVWHDAHFKMELATVPLGWYLAFYAVFTIFPFLFRKTFEGRVVPWAVAALAGPLHFRLIYQLADAAYRNPYMGLLPAIFAVPPLIALIYLIRTVPTENKARLSQLAWFGGSTLFFITLIFPIQFERQWITIGWALEGAALLWLWHRVPHNGLRLVGVGLLCVAFARLALNPAVLAYHPRSATPILNWYLYAYGITTVALFAGAKLLDPPRCSLGINGRALQAALGTVLAFLLLNIEIADYFTAAGAHTLTFQFSGNFARDMTYTIAWALFALTLLVAGIAGKNRPARYASMALLVVTLLKLSLHDLNHLDQLYRIGACIGVAIIVLVTSYLYKRFIPAITQEQ